MTFEMRRLLTTLWIGKVIVGLFFPVGEASTDMVADVIEAQLSEVVPAFDDTLRLHHPYPE